MRSVLCGSTCSTTTPPDTPTSTNSKRPYTTKVAHAVGLCASYSSSHTGFVLAAGFFAPVVYSSHKARRCGKCGGREVRSGPCKLRVSFFVVAINKAAAVQRLRRPRTEGSHGELSDKRAKILKKTWSWGGGEWAGYSRDA